MHRMAIAFSKWIFRAMNEENYDHRRMEVHIKDQIKKREKLHEREDMKQEFKRMNP